MIGLTTAGWHARMNRVNDVVARLLERADTTILTGKADSIDDAMLQRLARKWCELAENG